MDAGLDECDKPVRSGRNACVGWIAILAYAGVLVLLAGLR